MKLGIIDVGGGMRGIYAAGVLDTCLRDDIHFDCCIGVSAGSANMASYLAGQKGRNYLFYHDYSLRKEYMGFGRFLKTGSFLNLPYIYGTLSNSGGENPLDYEAIVRNPAEFITVATDARTGEARYFEKSDLRQDDYRIFMASSCVPGVDRPIPIGGTPYFDGALSDPVPLQPALDRGCERIVLLLTKPLDAIRSPKSDCRTARLIEKKYPRAAEGLRQRAFRYNSGVARMKELAGEGRALILAPEDTEGVDTLKRNPDDMDRLYRRGLRDGERILPWLSGTA